MGYESRVSTKGQVVVPKEIREKHGFLPGQRVEFVERGGALMLRSVPDANNEGPSTNEILARIAARNTYRGPHISDREINEAVSEMAAKRYLRSFD